MECKMQDYLNDIPPEYRKTPDLTLGDFAEKVTSETLPFFLARLANESSDKEYQRLIIDEAAKTLNKPPEGLLGEFQKYQQTSGNELIDLSCAIIGETDFLNMEIKPRPMIISPWLKVGDLVMITAPRGIGKSWLVHSLVTAITRKLTIGLWKTENPVECLLVDGEMASDDLQKRLRRITKKLPAPVASLDIMSADLMHQKGFPTPNLANGQWRETFYEFLKKSNYGLVIIDNVAALSPGLDENSKQEWDPINQFLLSIRFLGISVILIHHSGKDPKKTSQRGTSSHEDALDTSITLKQPLGYKQTDGCRFMVEFTKSRSVCGDGVRSFIFSLEDHDDDTVTWKAENKTSDPNTVIALLGNGTRQKDVTSILHIDKATVSRIKKKAELDSLLVEEKKGICKFTPKGQTQLGDYDISSLLSR
jgi:putative DNA primase/helicase